MAYPRQYEVEVTLSSGRDLKNVNWRNGPNRPYAVIYVDSMTKRSSRVDEEGDVNPQWNQTLIIPSSGPIDEDATLHIEIVHAGAEEGTNPLIGHAQIRLSQIIDEVGYMERAHRTLKLRRPSGRPHGRIDVKVCVREARYAPPPANAYPPQYQQSYPSQAPPNGYPTGHPQQSYSPPPTQPSYGGASPQPAYGAPPPGGAPQPAYGAPPAGGAPQPAYGAPPPRPAFSQPTPSPADRTVPPPKKFGFGAGLAAGAVGGMAGAFGGMALADHLDGSDSD